MKDPNSMKQFEKLMRNQRLLDRDNVVFTPHVAFNSFEAVERINRITLENIDAFARGKADQFTATICCDVCSGGRQPPNSIRVA